MDYRRFRQCLLLCLISVTWLSLVPVKLPLLRFFSDHPGLTAIGLIVSGLYFFMINRPLFMYACMGLGAVICLYYLDSELKEGNMENQNYEFRIKPDQQKQN